MKSVDIIRLYRHDFRAFIGFAFREAYPGKDFIDAWYLDVVADELMRCRPDRAHRLMLNLPPRYLKSFCTSIVWPLFMAAHHPGLRICIIAGSRELAAEFTTLRLRLLASKRLQLVFPQLRSRELGDTLIFANGSQVVQTHVSKSQTGRGADTYIIDDPLPARHASKEKMRNVTNAWYSDEVVTRLSKKDRASLIIVMQRLHREDLCGHILETETNWRQLSLSAIARRHESWELSNGRKFERRAGEVLCQEIETLETLQATLWAMNGPNFRAQYLQAPASQLHDHEHRAVFHKTRVPLDWKIGDPKLKPGGGLFRVREERFVEYEYFGVENPYAMGRDLTREEFEEEFRINQVALVASHRAHRRGPQEAETITSWQGSPHWRRPK